jgi:hypothetical protein
LSEPGPLPDTIVEFIESGVSVLVGTRDGALRPSTARAFGILVAADRRRTSIFLPMKTSVSAKANLDDNGLIAIGISRPFDNFAVQLKGRCVEVRAATEAERHVPERYLAAYIEQLYMIGFPRSLVKRAHVWPAWAATVAVEDIFVQTPGPDAGKRFEAE